MHKKDTDNLTVIFMLLGSEQIKGPHRMLVKLTTGVNFINILPSKQLGA